MRGEALRRRLFPLPDSVLIRPASPADAPAMLAIYAPYVRNTAVSFELEPPSQEEFAGRVTHTLARRIAYILDTFFHFTLSGTVRSLLLL